MSGALVGCGGDGDSDRASAEVRVVHASADAPAVNAGLDGGGQVQDLEFANARGFLEVTPGDYDVTVDGILPDGSTANVISASGVSLDADKETSILAVGKVGDGSIQPLVVRAPDTDPGSGQVRAQVVHAAAGAPEVDVYVTAPSADITASDVSPLTTLSFPSSADPVTIDSGEYRIRVTAAGDPSSVVFDSGAVQLAGDLLVSAIDNTGPANGPRSSPIRLLVAPEGGESFVLVDKDAQAAVRAAHLSGDAGSVDISLNNDDPVVTGLTFDNASFADNFTSFLAVPPGQQTVNVEQSGSVVVSASPELEAGKRYTGYALGLANPSMMYQALSLEAAEEDLRPVATEAKVRVIHAASQVPTDQGKVDVYLVPDQSATVSDLDADNRVLDDIPFKAVSDYLSVPPGDASTYRLFITAFNDPTVAPIEANLPALEGGGVYSVVALDEPDGSGGLQVASEPGILVDNAP